MILEKAFFLEVLKNYIHNEKTRTIQDIDFQYLSLIAKKHCLEPIFYKQLQKELFSSTYMFQLFYYVNQDTLIRELQKEIKGIEYFIFKGRRIAEVYPNPELRTMGDIDLLVHVKDQEYVHQKLIKLGYINTVKKNEQVWHYKKNVFEIELHNQLIYKNSFQNEKLEGFCNTCWQYYNNYEVDWNFHFVYLIIHLRKHFIRGGVGFRQFLDIALVCKNVDLDWNWIKTTAADLELIDFLKMVLTFNERWFAVPSPLGKVTISEKFFDLSTEKIFANGVFGYDDIQNATSKAEYEVNKYGFVKTAAKAVFLPYSRIVRLKGYDFLEGKEYLIPIAWTKRFVEKTIDYFRRYGKNDVLKKRTVTFFDEWGL